MNLKELRSFSLNVKMTFITLDHQVLRTTEVPVAGGGKCTLASVMTSTGSVPLKPPAVNTGLAQDKRDWPQTHRALIYAIKR